MTEYLLLYSSFAIASHKLKYLTYECLNMILLQAGKNLMHSGE